MSEELVVRKVKSAVRTVELLEYLAARHDEPARLREISHALDMPRSSAHALLRTLVAQGWVRTRCDGHHVRDRRAGAAGRHQLSGQRSVPAADHPIPRRPARRPRRDLPPRPPRRHRHRVPRDAGVQAVHPRLEPGRQTAARLRHRTRKVASRRAIRHRPRRARACGAEAVDRQDDRRPRRPRRRPRRGARPRIRHRRRGEHRGAAVLRRRPALLPARAGRDQRVGTRSTG